MKEMLTAWPEVFGDLAGVEADLRRIHYEQRYHADAWAWVTECVTTIDELDPQNPIKPFPVGVCLRCQRYLGHPDGGRCPGCGGEETPLRYLELITRQWQSGEPSLLVVPKARRMRMTWLAISLQVWLCWTRRHQNAFVVSSKEEKSGEIVDRARGIIARLPWDRMVKFTVQHRNTPPEIRFPNGSKIMGIPEGADQLRQYTASSILADEFGTWEYPRAAYAGMRPTIEGGGRLLIVSSAYPGFFREVCAGDAF